MPTRILVAEDDTLSLILLRSMLLSAGEFDVTTSTNGAEAWKLIEAGPAFDLCIFDVMMPELDGFELTKRLRDDTRFHDQKIILCTVYSEREKIDQAAALGISHYILKPYARDHVLKQVRRICGAPPAVAQLEPAAEVAGRLGVASQDIATFRLDMHKQLGALLDQLRAGPTGPEYVQLNLRINALKGAAVNLGARSLAVQLAAVEAKLNGLAPVAFYSLETEYNLLRRALEPEAAQPAKVA